MWEMRFRHKYVNRVSGLCYGAGGVNISLASCQRVSKTTLSKTTQAEERENRANSRRPRTNSPPTVHGSTEETLSIVFIKLSPTAAVSFAEKLRNSLHRADGTSRSVSAAAIFTRLASSRDGSGSQPLALLPPRSWKTFPLTNGKVFLPCHGDRSLLLIKKKTFLIYVLFRCI